MINNKKCALKIYLFGLLLRILLSAGAKQGDTGAQGLSNTELGSYYSDLEICIELNGDKSETWKDFTGTDLPTKFEFDYSSINDLKDDEKKSSGVLDKNRTSLEEQKHIETDSLSNKSEIAGLFSKAKNYLVNSVKYKAQEYIGDCKLKFSINLEPNYLNSLNFNINDFAPTSEVAVNYDGVMSTSQKLILTIKNLKLDGTVEGKFINGNKTTNINSNIRFEISSLIIEVDFKEYKKGEFPDISFVVRELKIGNTNVDAGKDNQSWLVMAAGSINSYFYKTIFNLIKNRLEKLAMENVKEYIELAKKKYNDFSTKKKLLIFFNGFMYDEKESKIFLRFGSLHSKNEIDTNNTTFTQALVSNHIIRSIY